jgi:DNA-binding response OmpR family regulator
MKGAGSAFARDSVHVHEVRSGADLYALCRKQPVDLVILEEMLDTVSARSVCRTLKSLDRAPIVIIVIESTKQDVIEDAKDAGADEVIVGAFDGRSLSERSAQLLGVKTRQAVRILTRLRIKSASDEDGPILLGTIVDISVSGMLVETNSVIEQGDKLLAEFYLSGQQSQVLLYAEAMRVDKQGDQRSVGMRFSAGQEDAIVPIEAFVHARSTK